MKRILLAIIIMLALLTACAESPESPTPESAPAQEPAPLSEPAPTITAPIQEPAPEPDIPEISEEEMAAIIWSRLPSSLPEGYTKSQFSSETGEATYVKDGKWEFQLSGSVSKSKSLPQRYYEKTAGNWVLNRSQEVTTYSLMLTANYYEDTGTLDILDIQKLDEKTTVETIYEEPVIGKGLKVNKVGGSTFGGTKLRVEGHVTNIGCVPLKNVIVEINTYDRNGKWLGFDETELSPSEINVGEDATFSLEIQQTLIGTATGEDGGYIIGKFTYRFVLPSGEEIYTEEPDQ